MPKVFISFPWQTRSNAEALATELEACGVSPWIAPRQLDPGRSSEEQILEAIKDADGVVFLITPGQRVSPWQQEEYMAALDAYWSNPSKVLVPVLIGNAECPPFLHRRSSLRVQGNRKAAWTQAAESIAKLLRQPKEPAKSLRQGLAERSKRFKTIERNVQELRTAEGKRLLVDALSHLSHAEDTAAVELLTRHVRKLTRTGEKKSGSESAAKGSLKSRHA